MDLDALLTRAVESGASDIHLKVAQPPMVRRDGAIGPLEGWAPLGETELQAALEHLCRALPGKRGSSALA